MTSLFYRVQSRTEEKIDLPLYCQTLFIVSIGSYKCIDYFVVAIYYLGKFGSDVNVNVFAFLVENINS